MDDIAGEFVMRCFHVRTNAHVMHLSTRSYAEHKALNEFYDAIIPLIDSFAEAYQGEYGLIKCPPWDYEVAESATEMLQELAEWVGFNRTDICEEDDTYIQNILDEIVALIRSTIYKLKFLK